MTQIDGFGLSLRLLGEQDAERVARLMEDQPPDYLRFFHVFGSDVRAIALLLGGVKRDVYAGIFWEGSLICVFMLRGWDEGYEVPAFGLVVARNHRGKEVLTMAMEAAKLVARLRGAARLLCKVHPDNEAGTAGALRLGWRPQGVEAGTGNNLYSLEL